MKELKKVDNNSDDILQLIQNISKVIVESKKKVITAVNTTLLNAYWNIGKLIVEQEQNSNSKSQYGSSTLGTISKELSKSYGKGFSVSNLQMMRRFYLAYRNQQTVSVKLSWSHYIEILSVTDEKARSFYQHECENSNWSVRELRRQISSSFYERLLLSKGDVNKEKLIELSKKGITYSSADDFVKDPMVLEFLGLPEEKPMLESDLERSLIEHIESFLLELGRGFMFVGSQYRISIDGVNYYVDMVFYNKILHAYLLIDLKMGKLRPENYGQMNMYLNYFKNEINDEGDKDPVGIILCAEKNNIVAQYSMEGLKTNIYASKYTYVIPNKEQLEMELQKVLENKKSD